MMVEEEKDVRESAMAICVSYCGRVFYFPVCVLVPLCEAVKICFAAPLGGALDTYRLLARMQ
jgi:hypothetical protein